MMKKTAAVDFLCKTDIFALRLFSLVLYSEILGRNLRSHGIQLLKYKWIFRKKNM